MITPHLQMFVNRTETHFHVHRLYGQQSHQLEFEFQFSTIIKISSQSPGKTQCNAASSMHHIIWTEESHPQPTPDNSLSNCPGMTCPMLGNSHASHTDQSLRQHELYHTNHDDNSSNGFINSLTVSHLTTDRRHGQHQIILNSLVPLTFSPYKFH